MAGRKPYRVDSMVLEQATELCVLRGWTHEDLAGALGLSKNTVDRWYSTKEEQRRRPSPDAAVRVRDLLRQTRLEKIKEWQKELVGA